MKQGLLVLKETIRLDSEEEKHEQQDRDESIRVSSDDTPTKLLEGTSSDSDSCCGEVPLSPPRPPWHFRKERFAAQVACFRVNLQTMTTATSSCAGGNDGEAQLAQREELEDGQELEEDDVLPIEASRPFPPPPRSPVCSSGSEQKQRRTSLAPRSPPPPPPPRPRPLFTPDGGTA